jgi:hypothetical protein
MTMPGTALLEDPVAKKKNASKAEPKQYGTLIRVSDEFAEAIRQASSFEKVSQREFADLHLLLVVQKRYRDAVLKEAKRIGGKGGEG